MKNLRKLAKVLTAGVAASLFTSAATAGPAVVITFAFSPTRVPTMSATALIALAVLLLVVAVRVLKSEHRTGFNLVVIISAASALALTTGSINLVSEASAGKTLSIFLSDENEGQISISDPGFYNIQNGTEDLQTIQSIATRADCSLGGPAFNGGSPLVLNGGGSSVGDCSDSPATMLEPSQFCDLAVFCGGGER